MSLRCVAALAVPALLALAVPCAAQEKKGKKYALLIGVTEYDHARLATLKYTANDVDELARTLGQANDGFDRITVLTDERGQDDKDLAPTAANVRRELDALLEGKKKHDLILIALAGHGVTLEVKDPDAEARPKSFTFFCPSDADLARVSYST